MEYNSRLDIAGKPQYCCYFCGKYIEEDEQCMFSFEWDAYVCANCYNKIINSAPDALSAEEKISKEEWT